MSNIVGYEFQLDFGDRTEWTQLHGCGGALGNGALHVQDARTATLRIAPDLLRRARAELEREGTVRRSNDARHDQPLTIEPVSPASIRACRPIHAKPQPPKIGDLATVNYGSDRAAFTVVDVAQNGRKVVLQERKSRRVDSNGLGGDQRWITVENPSGAIAVVTLRADGQYRIRGLGARHGGRCTFGASQPYRDPSF